MKQVLPIVVLAALTAAAGAAETSYTKGLQDNPKPKREKTRWGIQVGTFIPADSEIRDLFGDSLLKVGISPVSQRYEKKFAVTPDITFLSASGSDSRMLVIPLTLNASAGQQSGNVKTFVSVGAGPAYFDYKLRRSSGNGFIFKKDKTFGLNVNFEAGVLLNERFALEARYDWFDEMDGFDFSGWTVNANIVLFRW